MEAGLPRFPPIGLPAPLPLAPNEKNKQIKKGNVLTERNQRIDIFFMIQFGQMTIFRTTCDITENVGLYPIHLKSVQ